MPCIRKIISVDERTDGAVEVLDVKLNNRKTKQIGDKKKENSNNYEIKKSVPNNRNMQTVSAVNRAHLRTPAGR